jgi:hypothetical protein
MGSDDSAPPSDSPKVLRLLPFLDKTSKFLEEHRPAHAAIIAKGPLLSYAEPERPRPADRLPRAPFRLYDMDGRAADLRFETDGLFSNPGPGMGTRVFYGEINETRFTPIPGYENIYSQMTFRTDVGFRTFFFFPRQYEALVLKIVKSNA